MSDVETGPLLKPSNAYTAPTRRWYRSCLQISGLLELVLALICAGTIATSAYMGVDWLIHRVEVHGGYHNTVPALSQNLLSEDQQSEIFCCAPDCDASDHSLASSTLWSHNTGNSLRLACPSGETLSCVVSAGFVAAPSDANPSGDMLVPQNVWEGDCLGRGECVLEFAHGFEVRDCNALVDGEAVHNQYFDTVNGVQMDGLPELAYAQCVAVGMRVVAMCEEG